MLKVENTLNSNEGKGFVTINEKTSELFELTKLEANIELIVSERKILGHRMVAHKVCGAKGSGSITMFFNNSDILKEMINYIKTGKSPKISISSLSNNDVCVIIYIWQIPFLYWIFHTFIISKGHWFFNGFACFFIFSRKIYIF